MIAVPIVAGITSGIYGKLKYDEFRRQPAKEQFAVQNANAAALHFPLTVTFDSKIEILNLQAVDPNLSDIGSHSSSHSNDATHPNASEETEQKEEDVSTKTKKHFKSLSIKGMKWFNKMKDDAIQKIDEAQKDFDKMKDDLQKISKQREQKQNDNDNNEHKDDKDDTNTNESPDASVLFSDNVHLPRQHDIPSFFEPYIVNDIDTSKDMNALISSNMTLSYKWKECSVLMHEHCMYLKPDDEWKYLSLYNDTLQFIPLTVSNPHNLSFFYWTDNHNNYVIARCVSNVTVEPHESTPIGTHIAYNFVHCYISCKNDIVSKGSDLPEHWRKLWIMHENMLRVRDDIVDLQGNSAAVYHRNEFELDLKQFIRSEPDIRSDFWGKFEDTEYCAMTDCNAKFGPFMRPHHCYLCGRVICDKCGKNVFKNPIYENMEQRTCNDCFIVSYPKMKDAQSIFNVPLNEFLIEYNERKENQFEWKPTERSILKESALLCHWIYDGPLDPKLIEILGFKQHKLVLYGQESQSVQYAIAQSSQHEDTIYLVFRGSYDFMDWMTNFQTNPLMLQEIGFRVHSGMYCALQQHALDVVLNDLCQKLIIPQQKRLVICGHSLGGSYAVLSATYILAHHQSINHYFNQTNLKVVTFGAPLVLEKGVDKTTEIGLFLSKITTNFINQFDVVPRIGEGISLEYIKKLTEKSIDDSMRKVWGLKQVDSIFNLKIQDKIQMHLFERDDVKNLDKVHQEIYGAIGSYYLLMGKHKPTEVINFGKKKSVFVRQLDGICLFVPDPNKLLSLLPKRSGLFANHMLYDHFMNHYLTALYYMDK